MSISYNSPLGNSTGRGSSVPNLSLSSPSRSDASKSPGGVGSPAPPPSIGEVQEHVQLQAEHAISPVAVASSEEDHLSVAELEILANIQELQRQLAQLKQTEEEETEDEDDDGSPPSRVIVVANRLPMSASRDDKTGEWTFRMSSGGLVTALQGVRDTHKFIWIGWLGGAEVAENEQAMVAERLLREYSCVPVFLSDSLVDKYYNGFSNDVLWPLFHYVPLPMYKAGAEKKFDKSLWEAYKEANIIFAKVVSSVYEEGDFVWVHDYHLMRLPYELRQRHPRCRIGWFLHTPFPSSEIYRILPVRKPLLEGLLSADLVGFHTFDYARHFLSACTRVLEKVESSPRGVDYDSHFMSLGVFPVGIDPDFITKTIKNPSVQQRVQELRETFAGRKILLGVDRLDYIKGMPHKLLGLELFFTRYPEWRGKVTLIQVGVPSRTDVAEYKIVANQVNELVGRINGNFGTLDFSPVHYINQSVDQLELFAIYKVADVCIVSSLRDGMNLVSHEYVAAQQEDSYGSGCAKDGPGVLVLSEFAGSAQSLSGAIRVNPWNTEELASSIRKALCMSPVERELRQRKLYHYVSLHTASFWAKSFLEELHRVCARKKGTPEKLPPLPVKEVLQAYAQAKNRLIISDYDGTLTQLQSLPQLAGPPPFVTNLLHSMCQDPKNSIFIISGRERALMEKWLGHLRIGLASEFGFFYRLPDEKQWRCVDEGIDLSWKGVVAPIMQFFTERTPGTYIEIKESSLTWHYRDTDSQFGVWQAKDMQIHLEDVLSNLPLEILQGNCMVEVRHQAANKSMVADRVLRHLCDQSIPSNVLKGEIDFVFCVGDDSSDEDMFLALQSFRDQAKDPNVPPPMPPMMMSTMSLPGQFSSVPGATGLQNSNPFFSQSDGHLMNLPPPPTGDPPTLGMGTPQMSVQNGLDSVSIADTTVTEGLLGRHRRLSPDCAVYTVHIGNEMSRADFQLDSVVALRQVLRKFDVISKGGAVDAL